MAYPDLFGFLLHHHVIEFISYLGEERFYAKQLFIEIKNDWLQKGLNTGLCGNSDFCILIKRSVGESVFTTAISEERADLQSDG